MPARTFRPVPAGVLTTLLAWLIQPQSRSEHQTDIPVSSMAMDPAIIQLLSALFQNNNEMPAAARSW